MRVSRGKLKVLLPYITSSAAEQLHTTIRIRRYAQCLTILLAIRVAETVAVVVKGMCPAVDYVMVNYNLTTTVAMIPVIQ